MLGAGARLRQDGDVGTEPGERSVVDGDDVTKSSAKLTIKVEVFCFSTSVTISAERGDQVVRIAVADSGPGVPPDALERLKLNDAGGYGMTIGPQFTVHVDDVYSFVTVTSASRALFSAMSSPLVSRSSLA